MLMYLRCAVPAHSRVDAPSIPGQAVRTFDMPDLPGRQDLKILDPLPRQFTVGSTPTLEEIAKQPDVPHQGEPQPDPHQLTERVRVIVHGSDAALAAVVSKLMRIDALWVEVGFIPLDASSPIAITWGLDATLSPADQLHRAMTAPTVPTPVIRDDHGIAVLGLAEITGATSATGGRTGGEFEELVGEVIVDSATLYSQDAPGAAEFNNGVRMVPTLRAPGLAAVQRPPLPRRGVWGKIFRRSRGVEPTVLEGRALQAGGVDMRVVRDGIEHPRPLKSVTFYRHLRDGQFVRS